jgi:hypothetical protein
VIPFHFVISCSILSHRDFFTFIIIVLLLYLSHTLHHLMLYLVRLFIATLYVSIFTSTFSLLLIYINYMDKFLIQPSPDGNWISEMHVR